MCIRDRFCCLNYDTQAVELYNGSTLLGSYSQEIARTPSADLLSLIHILGDRGSGTVWASEVLSFTGELNRSCPADLILGMHADSYWYAGGLDDWFLDCDTHLQFS